MHRNIDTAAQERRKQEARTGALSSGLWMVFMGLLLLGLRWHYAIGGFWGAVMALAALLELGMVIPVWILYKKRIQEIEGGEEDAAAEY